MLGKTGAEYALLAVEKQVYVSCTGRIVSKSLKKARKQVN